MDPPRKAFPFTDEELDAAGLRGEGVSGFATQAMEMMREHPELLDLSLFTLECINYPGHREFPLSPASPTPSETPSYPSALTTALDATNSAPYALLDWERTTYYSGISPNPPELLYRSDLLENPFPIPKGRHPHPITKTVYGVFDMPLNAVWDSIAPQICEFLKVRKIQYSAIKAARFVTHGEDGEDTSAYDASPGILALLKANEVEGAVIKWYEGAVERLIGPHLLPVTKGADPTHYVRRFLTAALGMPIATADTGCKSPYS